MSPTESHIVTPEDIVALEKRLAKRPHHVERITLRGRSGLPRVIEYYPLSRHPDGTIRAPFPTLWWLVCPRLIRSVSRLEAEGWIGRIESILAEDPEFAEAYREDHRRYIRLRWEALEPADREELERRGWDEVYKERGIGGIADWRFVKCLHLHYAHHLADSNVVGAFLEEQCGVRP